MLIHDLIVVIITLNLIEPPKSNCTEILFTNESDPTQKSNYYTPKLFCIQTNQQRR
jgi:hypothetical protein